jgi:membrane protein YqaA with SNARE-associated domain
VHYVLIVLLVFANNLLPAFGPPTWTLLVFGRLNWGLNPVALVVMGAVAAGAGRYLLALGARRFRGHLSDPVRDNLTAASDALVRRKGSVWATLAFFAISPLPSAQLFVAAGLLEMELVPLTVAFVAGRLVSYSLYVGAASVAERHFGNVLGRIFGSPWSIAIQVALLIGVAVLPFVPWRRILGQRSPGDGPEGAEAPPGPRATGGLDS